VSFYGKYTGIFGSGGGGGGGGGNAPYQEIPAGAINGVNVTFTVSVAPADSQAFELFLDGLILVQGTDYNIVGSTITMAVAPNFGQLLYAVYSVTSGSTGGVTSVGSTAPVVSSGGATPVISMPVADTATDGYLSSVDWNIFNNKQDAGLGWLLAGNAGTGGTGILGTTDAQDFSIRANNTNILTFSGANPAFSSGVTQVPADATSLNQFDLRTYVTPAASTTGANNTSFNSQLVYDNGNTGYDFSGNLITNNGDFTHNGSGTINSAVINYNTANFNNSGVTNTFHGSDMYASVASGSTVTNYMGSNLNLNSTGGIFSTVYGLNSSIGFDSVTHANVQNIASSMNFSGTDTNSQGVAGFSDYQQYNDTASTANGVYAVSSGIDVNDSANLSAGITPFNTYINLRDSSTTNGVSLVNVSLNQQDAATSNSANAFNANLQYSNTSDGGDVNVFNGYAHTVDTANLNSLTVINSNPEIEGSSTLGSFTGLNMYGQIRGNSTVTNINGGFISPQMSGSASADNLTGLTLQPQVNGSASLLNGITGLKVIPASTVGLNGATGVNIDMGSVTLDSAYIASGGQKKALSINDGAIEAGLNYTIPGAAGFFQQHYIGGAAIVANGDPTAAFGFGTNLAQQVQLHDDWTLDGAGLGYIDVGFVGSLAFDVGTTMARWTGALGGAGNPSGAGTLTDAIMFRAAGILPQGGTLAVTNAYGFQVDPNLFGLTGTNSWGFYEDTASAENHLSKLAIGTATKKVSNTDTALEIGNSKAFLNGSGSTATRLALTAIAGMQFYDTTLNTLYWYNGTSWVDASGGSSGWLLSGNAGTTAGTDFVGTTDAEDLVFKTNSTEVMRIDDTNKSLLVGTTSLAPFAISAYRNQSDPPGQSGAIYGNLQTHQTVNGFNLNAGIQSDSKGIVDVGISEGGGNIGVLFSATRNSGATDAGSMGYLVGAFGGANQTSSSGTTAILAGFLTQQNITDGTATDAYDFYALPGVLTGGTTTNRYGIYVSPDDVAGKINYLADRLAIGPSYSAPTRELDVNGDARIRGLTTAGYVTTDASGNLSSVAIPAAQTDIQETPVGAVDNSNVTFTLSQTPVSNASVLFYLSGLMQEQGVDYNIAGSTITMTTAPNFGQRPYAAYRY
jgi:hypothetical protein